MKTIQIVYTCDYCKRPIDQLSEDVKAIIPGRIGYGDKFMADKGGDDIRHYHDYCLENLLAMEYVEETEKAPEPEKSEEQGSEANVIQEQDTIPKPEPQEEPVPEPGKGDDLNLLRELLKTNMSKKDMAAKLGYSVSTLYK